MLPILSWWYFICIKTNLLRFQISLIFSFHFLSHCLILLKYRPILICSSSVGRYSRSLFPVNCSISKTHSCAAITLLSKPSALPLTKLILSSFYHRLWFPVLRTEDDFYGLIHNNPDTNTLPSNCL